MQINYTADSLTSLIRLINFIEDKNTSGAGERWLNKFEIFIENMLLNSLTISLCNNQTFKRLKLRCIYFNDWIIAFSIDNDTILIEALLHKSRVID